MHELITDRKDHHLKYTFRLCLRLEDIFFLKSLGENGEIVLKIC